MAIYSPACASLISLRYFSSFKHPALSSTLSPEILSLAPCVIQPFSTRPVTTTPVLWI